MPSAHKGTHVRGSRVALLREATSDGDTARNEGEDQNAPRLGDMERHNQAGATGPRLRFPLGEA